MSRKPLSALVQEASSEGEHSLERSLTAMNLTLLGIGAIIGAGIFVLTGTAAAQHAGPAIVISFVFAGLGCVFAGLCYAEFASMIPIAGSAYTYGHATLGELLAWIIGWDLILEYLFAASTVAVGWSGYFVQLLRSARIELPHALVHAPLTVEGTTFLTTGAIINLPAGILVLRYRSPELHRPFRTPLVPFVPLGGIITCGYLMYSLPLDTWLRLAIWMALGLAIYVLYGRTHSKLAKASD